METSHDLKTYMSHRPIISQSHPISYHRAPSHLCVFLPVAGDGAAVPVGGTMVDTDLQAKAGDGGDVVICESRHHSNHDDVLRPTNA
ncbi:hypothetical protein BS47DRAFT_1348438 [Hydnum rufescens UP504]|uniref:Uncharacterized protein n=1 Tax=Hydnum rufescens UP504 TaxID=1448309 RepID=A0A9P6DQH2_9AGAM|nr:hypothetical protein BS47DRAFT_1348438 [Hydnum rufescens UP504]